MNKKEKIAKIIRAVTVPPFLVLMLMIILFFANDTIFANIFELILTILFLMLIPVAAYPTILFIPKYKKNVREAQRTLAFILSIIGYISAVVYGLAAHVGRGLMLIYLTYFISVVILTVFNKIIKLRASGHACSVAGPLILLVYFIGWEYFLPCTALFALSFWASLTLKRHTPKELFMGSCSALIAFVVSLLTVLI